VCGLKVRYQTRTQGKLVSYGIPTIIHCKKGRTMKAHFGKLVFFGCDVGVAVIMV